MTQRNAFFGSTLYQESDVVMSSNAQSLLCSKRKRWSPVREDFTKYVGENGKEWAKCNHYKREFEGSSKSGITHLKNYLKSCPILRTLDRVADKEKKKSVIGQELNGFNWVQRTINYELSDIKDDILLVYEQEKCELRGYLDKLPSHFGIRIEGFQYDNWYMEIYFVDDSWELRNTIIYFNDGDYDHEIMKSVLVDWSIHKKIFFVITDHEEDDVVAENLKTWFSKRGILHLIEQYLSGPFSLSDLWLVSLCELNEISPSKILTKASYLRDYVSEPSNAQSFDNAVTEATSKGKMVTSQSVPQSRFPSEILLEWTVGCKEAFCELEHIDPKSISFTKKDWDDATLMYSCWQVLKDLKKEEINNLSDEIHFFLRLDQLRMSDDSFLPIAASWCEHHIVRNWKSFGMVIDISVILDPRSTMEMVKRYYKIIYGNDAEADLHKMIGDVIIFFNYYVKGTSSSSSSHDSNTILELELKRYLKEEHPQDKGFDILQWWRDKSPIYPTLARMARDLLSIPYELSCLKFYLRDKIKDVFNCTTLDDDFKKKLACTKIWLYTSGNN